jgi:hypothetical protein
MNNRKREGGSKSGRKGVKEKMKEGRRTRVSAHRGHRKDFVSPLSVLPPLIETTHPQFGYQTLAQICGESQVTQTLLCHTWTVIPGGLLPQWGHSFGHTRNSYRLWHSHREPDPSMRTGFRGPALKMGSRYFRQNEWSHDCVHNISWSPREQSLRVFSVLCPMAQE